MSSPSSSPPSGSGSSWTSIEFVVGLTILLAIILVWSIRLDAALATSWLEAPMRLFPGLR